MKNTRRKNVVVYIIKDEKKLYYKGYSLDGRRLWTSDVNKAIKKSIGEAKKYIVNCLYNHDAYCEVAE